MRRKHTGEKTTSSQKVKRKGVIAVLAALLMIALLGMAAFAIDYGYLVTRRAHLQRAADAAALAAVRDLVPDNNGSYDLAKVRATVREYAASNVSDVSDFKVLDSDIEVGRYNPATVYTNFAMVKSGTHDTIRVTLRRDNQANSPVSLFFARVLGIKDANVNATATAIMQKASNLIPGTGILPFAIPQDRWNALKAGEELNVYGDGKLKDASGTTIPGNWGTVDIGDSNNTTSDLRDQIEKGLRQKDLDALYKDGRIPSKDNIDGTKSFYANGDPGLSSGMKSAVEAIHGQTRLLPIYDSVTGQGNNTEFRIVGWAVCEVVDSYWGGSQNTYVKIQKQSFTYDTFLKPQPDLSKTAQVIDGAFTSPVLVQ